MPLSQPYTYPSKKQHLVSLKKFSTPRPACQHHLLYLNALWDRSHKSDNLIFICFGNDCVCQPSYTIWAKDESFCFQLSFSSSSFYYRTWLQKNFLSFICDEKASQSIDGWASHNSRTVAEIKFHSMVYESISGSLALLTCTFSESQMFHEGLSVLFKKNLWLKI